jgi:alkylation response protein AidB-like acyl-CoA dehydrogenase
MSLIYDVSNKSPYYNDSHKAVRTKLSQFLDKEIVPYVSLWEENEDISPDIIKKFGQEGFYKIIISAILNEKPYDLFHVVTILDEFAKKTACGGLVARFFASFILGFYPIIKYGSTFIKNKVVKDLIDGTKTICLAVSEPSAGSDFPNMETVAVKKDGKYILTGNKKWITCGIYADYIVVATKVKNENGAISKEVSLLLLEKGMPGIKTRKMKCTGFLTSGTTFITLENVVVPECNLIGKENDGFRMIVQAFNYERLGSICGAIASSKVCIEESINHCAKRKTFGKELITRQTVRHRIGEMIKRTEMANAWLESLIYQLECNINKEFNQNLSAKIALLKSHGSKLLEFCTSEASQLFGGSSYVKSGVGEKIERLSREVRGYEMAGGSGDILMETAIKILLKEIFLRSKL